MSSQQKTFLWRNKFDLDIRWFSIKKQTHKFKV